MQRRVKGLLISGILGFLCCITLGQPALATTTTQSIAFPMYEYPTIGTLWADMNAAGSQVPFLIVNPGSGPGTSVDPTYTSHIATNTSSGQRSIGYVHSNYQARPIAEMFTDIDTFYQFYPGITGIFIDLVENGDANDLCYAATAHNYIKSKHPSHLVVMNFGNNVEARYEPYSDIFGNAENFYSVYTAWAPLTDGFENNATYANRFWHMVHTATSGQLANALALTRTNNAGWVLVTNETMPNPYMVTPSYWSTFLTGVATLPQSTIPNRGLTALPAGCVDLSLTTASNSSTATKQINTNITNTVKNTDTSRVSWGSTKVSYSLPSGASLSSLDGGAGWSCSAGSSTCTYAGNTAANTTLPDITATIAVGCDYQSGSATVTLQNFAANTASTTVALSKPSDCTASSSSGSTSTTTSKAAFASTVTTSTTAPAETAQTTEPTSTSETPSTTQPNRTSPVQTTPNTEESQPASNNWGVLFWIVAVIFAIALAVWGFIIWRRRQ